MFGPKLIAQSAVSKNRTGEVIFLRRQFWKREISTASRTAFPVGLGDFFGCRTPSEVFWFARIHSLLVNGVVIASGENNRTVGRPEVN